MPEQKLNYDQVADRRLFEPLKKELTEVDELLKAVETSLKEVVSEATKLSKQTPLDSFENIEKREKAIKDTTKALQDLDKVEADRVKLQKQLDSLEDSRIQNNFDLREQIRLQTKDLRDNARATAEQNNAYKVLTRRTNDAQAEFKRLAAEFGTNSEQAQEALKEFERLDDSLREINEAARDGRRDVGRYEKGVAALSKTFNRFAKATLIIEVFKLLQNAINANSEGAAEFEKIWINVTATVAVTANRLITVFEVLAARIERSVISIRLNVSFISDLFNQNSEDTARLREEYEKLAEVAETDLDGVFDGMQTEIEEITRLQKDLVDSTLDYRREIASLQKQIADIIPVQEELRAGFEDDSTSLENQIQNGVAFREELQKRQALEEEIAVRRLKLAQENALANRFNVSSQEELSQATLEYNQIIAGQVSELRATEREIQKLRDDATQLNLDFYVDDAQNRIDTNARIIASDAETFARRREALNENIRETQQANDLRAEALNKSLRERGKAELDFEKLRQMTSSEDIARSIRESGISEQLAVRALEIIRERRTELQDLREAQQDLNAAEAESRLLQDDVALQREALSRLQEKGVNMEMVLAELSKARLQNEIDNIRAQIKLQEDAAREDLEARRARGEDVTDLFERQSAELLKLNQELNDKLLEQDKQGFDERRKQLEGFTKAAQTGFEVLGELAAKQNSDRLETIDKEISLERDRLNSLNQLAAQGNEDAENNLAITEQRQRELELERQRQIERQEKQELALVALQTYGAKVAAGDPNPLVSTISDIEVLRAFVGSLPSFFEGTEDTGKVSNALDSKGGRLAVLHDNERVIDKANNRIIGAMSNNELAQLAAREKSQLSPYTIDTNRIVTEIRTLAEVTRSRPSYLGSDFDAITEQVTHKIKKGRRLDKIHVKKGGIWGDVK